MGIDPQRPQRPLFSVGVAWRPPQGRRGGCHAALLEAAFGVGVQKRPSRSRFGVCPCLRPSPYASVSVYISVLTPDPTGSFWGLPHKAPRGRFLESTNGPHGVVLGGDPRRPQRRLLGGGLQKRPKRRRRGERLNALLEAGLGSAFKNGLHGVVFGGAPFCGHVPGRV